MSIFALVHGGWHGAWRWERLIGPLRDRGGAERLGVALRTPTCSRTR